MHSNIIAAMAITVLAVSGCNEEPRALGGGNLSPQPPQGSAGQAGCGAAIFDPVPDFICADLDLAAPPSGIDALPGGYWSGRFADETQAVQGYVEALVAEDGRFQLQAYRFNDTNTCHNWRAGLSGTMTTVGNAMSGSGRIIAAISTLADGTQSADLQVDGVVAERGSITGRWNASSGDAGCFQLDQYWAGSYEAPSALAKLQGEWTDRYSSNGGRITIGANGSLTGSDGHGCSWSGHFALIDDRYSLYEFDTELRSCDQAGHYTGLAWHGLGWDPGEYWLKILAGDGQHALLRNFSNR